MRYDLRDKKLKLWVIVINSVCLILFILIFIWSFTINPLGKDVYTPWVPGICMVFTTCYSLINIIPALKKNRGLWASIVSILSPITFGVLYFLIL